MGQEFRPILAGASASGSPNAFSQGVVWDLSDLKVNWVSICLQTHSVVMERVQFRKWVKWVPWLLAGWWPEAILSSLPGSPRPQSKQAWRARDRNLSKMKISLCNLITEVISHHLYCIRFIKNHHYQVQLTFKGRGLHEGVVTRKWGHWAPGQQ